MKALIGERPNAKPVGIGNSASELDLDVLAPGTQDNSLEDAEPIMPSENDDDEEDQVEDQRHTQNKHLASVAGLDQDIKPKPGTPARPNVSKPTVMGTKPKKLKGFEELAEISVAEEATCQKEIDLKIQKLKDKASRTTAKVELKKAELEAKKEKMKQTHEVEIMKLQLELAKTRQVAPGIGVGIPTQLGQGGSVHSPDLYPAFGPGFGFGDGNQFDGMMSQNKGTGD